jgi:hypothetical protein
MLIYTVLGCQPYSLTRLRRSVGLPKARFGGRARFATASTASPSKDPGGGGVRPSPCHAICLTCANATANRTIANRIKARASSRAANPHEPSREAVPPDAEGPRPPGLDHATSASMTDWKPEEWAKFKQALDDGCVGTPGADSSSYHYPV